MKITTKIKDSFTLGQVLQQGRNLEWLMQALPRDRRTLYGLLRKYGKDIAGALNIYDPDDSESFAKPEKEFYNSTNCKDSI